MGKISYDEDRDQRRRSSFNRDKRIKVQGYNNDDTSRADGRRSYFRKQVEKADLRNKMKKDKNDLRSRISKKDSTTSTANLRPKPPPRVSKVKLDHLDEDLPPPKNKLQSLILNHLKQNNSKREVKPQKKIVEKDVKKDEIKIVRTTNSNKDSYDDARTNVPEKRLLPSSDLSQNDSNSAEEDNYLNSSDVKYKSASSESSASGTDSSREEMTEKILQLIASKSQRKKLENELKKSKKKKKKYSSQSSSDDHHRNKKYSTQSDSDEDRGQKKKKKKKAKKKKKKYRKRRKRNLSSSSASSSSTDSGTESEEEKKVQAYKDLRRDKLRQLEVNSSSESLSSSDSSACDKEPITAIKSKTSFKQGSSNRPEFFAKDEPSLSEGEELYLERAKWENDLKMRIGNRSNVTKTNSDITPNYSQHCDKMKESRYSDDRRYRRQNNDKEEFYVKSVRKRLGEKIEKDSLNEWSDRKDSYHQGESKTISFRESKSFSKISFTEDEVAKQKLLNDVRNKGKSKSSNSIKMRIGDTRSSPQNCKDSLNNVKIRIGDKEQSNRYRDRDLSYDSRRSSSRGGDKRSSVEHYDAVSSKRHKSDYEKLEDSLTSDSVLDYKKKLDDFISRNIQLNRRKSKADIWCCDFCGIAAHSIADCPESKENGRNPKDPLGDKERCLECNSYNHLVSDCVHTEEKGSNAFGKDGKKYQCKICRSYDHMTNACGKVHSEEFGRNKTGISGKKLSCDQCNSFNHVGSEHGRDIMKIPCCDHCGEFSHSSVNCPQISSTSSLRSKEVNDNVFKWTPLPCEVEQGICGCCRSPHHSFKTCPYKHDRKYGRNPIRNGVMESCVICGSFSHLERECFHSEVNGNNPKGADGRKMQCIYCYSYNHVVNCREVNLEKYGINPIQGGVKIRCLHCGSYAHLPQKCKHSNSNLSYFKTRCKYCGSYEHRTEQDCLNENDMVRDYLRMKLGIENKITVANNRWTNMQSLKTTKFVEEISEEEKQKQKEDERLRLERLRIKFDKNYVPESKTQVNKENSPASEITATGVKIGFLEVDANPVDMVYTEPDESVFLDVDVRTNTKEQPKITTQMHNEIIAALTGEEENVISTFNIHITKKDLYGLTGQNWINDKIVEIYMQMLAKRSLTKTSQIYGKPRVYCMSTYFFLNLIMRGYGAVARWTKDVDIFSYDIILVPIHLEMHWCLAIVDFRSPGVFYYDSMSGHNMPALTAILNYLREEHLKKKGVELDLTKFAKDIAECPQQQNGADCGIFACKIADFVTREEIFNFSQEDMQYFRKRMIWEIVKQQLLTP